jgi:hypothetical protein
LCEARRGEVQYFLTRCQAGTSQAIAKARSHVQSGSSFNGYFCIEGVVPIRIRYIHLFFSFFLGNMLLIWNRLIVLIFITFRRKNKYLRIFRTVFLVICCYAHFVKKFAIRPSKSKMLFLQMMIYGRFARVTI